MGREGGREGGWRGKNEDSSEQDIHFDATAEREKRKQRRRRNVLPALCMSEQSGDWAVLCPCVLACCCEFQQDDASTINVQFPSPTSGARGTKRDGRTVEPNPPINLDNYNASAANKASSSTPTHAPAHSGRRSCRLLQRRMIHAYIVHKRSIQHLNKSTHAPDSHPRLDMRTASIVGHTMRRKSKNQLRGLSLPTHLINAAAAAA